MDWVETTGKSIEEATIEPSPTSAYIATTLKSKSSKSPRRDCSVAFVVKPECELVFARVAHVPNVRAAPAVARSDRVRTHRAVRSRALREAKLNHGETAKRPVPVVNLKAP